mmetsp:Transcript_84743/g.197064  ORF Transcript_84743/g.197064 Transcript_84743/m.197064 type:complete len:230 (-) Transcript_84743:1083-1772(-)
MYCWLAQSKQKKCAQITWGTPSPPPSALKVTKAVGVDVQRTSMQMGHSAVRSSSSTIGCSQWSMSSPSLSRSAASIGRNPALPWSACSSVKSKHDRPSAVAELVQAPRCTITRATCSQRSSSVACCKHRASMVSPALSSSTSRSRRRAFRPSLLLPLTERPIQTASFRARLGRFCCKLACQSAGHVPSLQRNVRLALPEGQCSRANTKMSHGHDLPARPFREEGGTGRK